MNLYTTNAAASYCGLNASTFRYRVSKGKGPRAETGHNLLVYTRESLDTWIADGHNNKINNVSPHTTISVVSEFKLRYGDRYNYSATIYVNAKTPVVVICPIHGEFQVLASAHRKGKGCTKCA